MNAATPRGSARAPRIRKAVIGELSANLDAVAVEGGAVLLIKGGREPLHLSAPEVRKLRAMLEEADPE